MGLLKWSIDMQRGKKIYFASDQHFGAPNPKKSGQREQLFLQWLAMVEKDAAVLFLLGDLFDFWFEYQSCVPKGFVRILGKLATLRDQGIEIHFFTGNHDLWVRDYFQKELQFNVYEKPQLFTFGETTFYLGHGDGLGPGDKGYKRMKKVFTHPLAKWLYRWLHPDIGIPFARYLSLKNKLISGKEAPVFMGKDQEWLYQYAELKSQQYDVDYFVFGHRHLPLELPLRNKGVYINTGDWLHHNTYAVFDGITMSLKTFKPNSC